MLGRSAAARRAAELLHLMHLGVTRHMAQLMNVYGSELLLILLQSSGTSIAVPLGSQPGLGSWAQTLQLP